MKVVMNRPKSGFSKPEKQLQTAEYMPPGPVRVAKPAPRPKPQPKRVSGYLYDAQSGVIAGLASDELKAQQKAGVPFERVIGGMKQLVVIHP